MDNFAEHEIRIWSEQEEDWRESKDFIEELIIEEDCLSIYIDSEIEGQSAKRIKIPMTPSNIEILKKQLSMSGAGKTKETDSKGRFNLGIDYKEQNVECFIYKK